MTFVAAFKKLSKAQQTEYKNREQEKLKNQDDCAKVAENIRNELNLPIDNMLDFLTKLIDEPPPVDKTQYCRICADFEFSVKNAGHPDGHVVLSRAVDIKYLELESDPQLNQSAMGVNDSIEMQEIAARIEFELNDNIEIGGRNCVFACFRNDIESAIDLKNSERVFQLLGMKSNSATPDDTSVVLFKYNVSNLPTNPGICIPTVADAQCKSEFLPSPKNATCGQTVDLIDPTGKTLGIYEIVHKNIRANETDLDELKIIRR